jgi:hypothetical protein
MTVVVGVVGTVVLAALIAVPAYALWRAHTGRPL